MGTKLRKQQLKKEWTESGTLFSPEYLAKIHQFLEDSEGQPHAQAFGIKLAELPSLRSTFAEKGALKIILSRLNTLAVCQGTSNAYGHDIFLEACSLMSKMLFLPRSQPIHRQLLSGLLQIDGNQQQKTVIQSITEQVLSNATGLGEAVKQGHFDFADGIASLLAMPRLHDVIRPNAATALLGLAQGLQSIVTRPFDGSGKHISPRLADQAQEAISCTYSLMSRCAECLRGDSGCEAILAAASALQAAIKGAVLPRETRAAAAVAFSAALQVPDVHPAVTALQVAKACCPDGELTIPGGVPDSKGFLYQAGNSVQVSVLVNFMADAEQIAQICLLRGLVSGLPTAVWLQRLTRIQEGSGRRSQDHSHHDSAVNAAMPASCCSKQQGTEKPWCLLTDGVLPLACNLAEEATDGHTQFHAQVLISSCLLQMLECRKALRTELQTDDGHMQQEALLLKGLSGNDTMQDLPLLTPDPPQQPHTRPTLNDFRIHSQQQERLMCLMWAHWEDPLPQTVKQVHTAFGLLLDLSEECSPSAAQDEAHSVGIRELHVSLASKLLEMRGHRKGKYGPLAGLVPRMGAKALLGLEPNLLVSCMEAMQLDAVCKSASSLLASLLNNLWLQLHTLHQGDEAMAIAAWEETWIPPLLQLLATADDRMLSHLSIYAMPVPLAKNPSSILQLLKRLLQPSTRELLAAQVPSIIAVLKTARQLQLMDGLGQVMVPGQEPLSLPHRLLEKAVIDGSETIRLDVMQLACLHPKSTAFPGMAELSIVAQAVSLSMRGEGAGIRSKWLTLLNQLLHRINVASHAALHRQAMCTKSRQPPDVAEAEADGRGLSEQRSFLEWLSRLIIASLYPGAASQRKVTALMILNLIQQEWFPSNFQEGMDPSFNGQGEGAMSRSSIREKPSAASGQVFVPFCQGFMGAPMTQSLLGCLIDGWTRLRDACATALLQMPTPLPAYEEAEPMQALVSQAVGLLQSPRVRESDAGARLLAIIFQKHVVQLGWSIDCATCSQVPVVVPSSAHGDGPAPVMVFIEGLLRSFQTALEAGKEDLLTACKSSLAHGPLLTLRYIMPNLPWHLGSLRQLLQPWLSRLLGSLERAMHLTLPPLARPQEANMGADDVDVLGDEEGDDLDMDGDLGPETQVITTGCWLTMKEATLVIGKIADHAPTAGMREGMLLTSEQTIHIGTLLLDMLLKMKHNGAVDIAHEGLCSVVKRVLKHADASLNTLPSQWLQQLLARVSEPGQSRDDIIRRSAGLPPAFMSIFLAEPQGTHKHLLHVGLSGLLVTAGQQEEREPWPCVHSLNCLRMAFNHTDLALDSSGFFAQGMQIAIMGMDASAWEIRNSASLLYAALIMRMLGFRNMQQGELPRRAVTAADFFHRYPSLHAFLLERLRQAILHLTAARASACPSLFPILALLSRLRPSAAARKSVGGQHPLSPEAFVALVLNCGKAQSMAVRSLAAQALAAVAPLDDSVLVDQLLSQLPSAHSPIGNQNLVHGTLLQLRQLVTAASLVLEVTPDWLQLLPVRLQNSASLLLPSSSACPAVRSALLSLLTSLQAALPDPARQLNHKSAAQDTKVVVDSNSASDNGLHNAANGAATTALQEAMHEAAIAALETTCTDPGNHPGGAAGPTSVASKDGSAQLSNKASLGITLQLPYQAIWLTQATKALLDAPGTSERQDVLAVQLLQHPGSEVRAAAAKALLLKAAGGTPQELHVTQELSEQSILQESNLKVLRRLLSIASLAPVRAQPQAPSNEDGHLPLTSAHLTENNIEQHGTDKTQPSGISNRAPCSPALMQRLISLARSNDAAIRQGALCCLGKSVGYITNHSLLADQPSHVEAVQLFLELVSEAVRPWQPWQVRAAAARALQQSGLLQDKAAQAAGGSRQQQVSESRALSAWRAIIGLMEDEDEDVQSAAASAAACAFGGDRPASTAHVDWVQRHSFEFISETFGSSQKGLQQLLDWVYSWKGAPLAQAIAPGSSAAKPDSTQASHTPGGIVVQDAQLGAQLAQQPPQEHLSPPGTRAHEMHAFLGSNSRLFDREPDNRHAEPLLLAQLAATQIRKLCQRGALSPSLLQQLADWLSRISQDLERLAASLQALPASEHASAVLQTCTYRPAMFEQLTRALLGIEAAQRACTGNLQDSVSLRIHHLQQLPLHPVLRSLLDGACCTRRHAAHVPQVSGTLQQDLSDSQQPGLKVDFLTEAL